MADRFVPLVPIPPPGRPSFKTARPRPAFAVILIGLSLLPASWIGLRPDRVDAADGRPSVDGALVAISGGAEPSGKPSLESVEIQVGPASESARGEGLAASQLGTRRPVCVRLCDGYFFPVAEAAADASGCANLCPDAATALYFLPPGSDRIEDAASSGGAPYSALPTALRYRTTRAKACACHGAVAEAPPYWQDPTLRKGDAVVTADGVTVFRGAGGGPYTQEDFTGLAAAAISPARRMALAAVGRVIDDRTGALLAALLAYPDVKTEWKNPIELSAMPVIPIGFVRDGEVLSYFSMVTTVGTPQTIAAQELRIECMFPADAATEAHHRKMMDSAPAS